MRRPLAVLALLSGLLLAAPSLRAETVVVAVDADFAPVAQALTQSFTARTGHELELTLRQDAEAVPPGTDVLLAQDAALPARLAAEGLADPETLITYAMGLTGTEAATAPRDAVLLAGARENAVARDFLAFLETTDAWDLIVTHGYGAY